MLVFTVFLTHIFQGLSDLKGSPWREMLVSTAFLTHIFWRPLRSKGVPHGGRCSYPQLFLHISSGVPSDLKGSPWREMLLSTTFLTHIFQGPLRSKGFPMERYAHIHSLSYTYLPRSVRSKGVPIERDARIDILPYTYLLGSPQI